MANIIDIINSEIFYLDGGTGSLLQQMGLKPGELPETWNIINPSAITKVARDYYEAGSHAVCTNTFGANSLKYDGRDGRPTVEEVVLAAYKCADDARKTAGGELVQSNRFIALDLGPLGKMLKPFGDLDFEDAVSYFAETVRAGVKAGVDFILIETMNDAYETKAAVLAAKENSDLPLFVSNVYDETSKLMTGATPEVMSALLDGLGADVYGANCSLGPAQMSELVKRFLTCANVPLLIKPNAGLPKEVNGQNHYDVGPKEFAEYMKEMVQNGARVVGGCCGTTPEYIRELVIATKDICPVKIKKHARTVVTSYSEAVYFDDTPILIGERINPAGKKLFKEALRNHDIAYVLNEGIRQQDLGVHILDVNVGLPEIDEPALLKEITYELQSVTTLPLQLDTTNVTAMENSMRIYNGKPMVNSVNGKEEVMNSIFPLVKKYGGLVVCLTLDEDGIPDTAEGRYKIAEKIAKKATEFGIGINDLIFDPLAMAVSSDTKSPKVTIDTIKLIKERLSAKCSLGISNVSFGLPERDYITSTFFLMTLEAGLDAAIMNPFSFEMQKTVKAYRALSEKDENCLEYMRFVGDNKENTTRSLVNNRSLSSDVSGKAGDSKELNGSKDSDDSKDSPLSFAIVRGLKDNAAKECEKLLKDFDGLDIINEHIIPALDKVGKGFENKTIFLPQLLLSAEAAKSAFTVIKNSMGTGDAKGPKVIIATVKGDIHDIGKNIVKVLLENYNFNVIDLGKDVPPELIVETAIKENVSLVGLSALMTTTVPSMAETIRQLREVKPDTKVVVGGAVLTQEYADMIGADKYSGNAMETVRYAQEVLMN